MRSIKTWLMLLLAVLLFWQGCMFDDVDHEVAAYRGPKNSCRTADDCESKRCDKNLSICVAAETLENRQIFAKVYLKESPPQIFPLSFSKNGKATVDVKKPLTISFIVQTRTPASNTPLNLDARIIFIDNFGLPGQAPRLITTRVAELGSNIARVSLGSGEKRYSMRVHPTSATESAPPPLYLDNVSVVPGDTSEDTPHIEDEEGEEIKWLILPAAMYAITGEIYRGPQPLSGFRVVVVDLDTGRELSTPSITGCLSGTGDDSVCGEFEVRMHWDVEEDEEAVEYGLRIVKESDPTYPELVAIFDKNDVVDGTLNIVLNPLANPVRFDARVEGKVVLSSGEVVHDGVAGCLLEFESEELSSDIEQRVVISARSDHAGRIRGLFDEPSIFLYPGSYLVSIIPPPFDTYAIVGYGLLQVERSIEALSTPITDQIFTLPYRYDVRGRVVWEETPIPGARISAYPLENAPSHADGQFSVPAKESELSLWLDQLDYRIIAEVPKSSGFAYWISTLSLEEATDPSDQNLPVVISMGDITPPFPVVARLTLKSEALDVSGVRVEWYEVIGDEALLIGRSTSSSTGKVEGLLPPAVEATLPGVI